MAIPTTARRGLIAAAILLVIYLFMSSSTTSIPSASYFEQPKSEKPARPYPPSIPNQQAIKQEVATKPLRERLKYHFPYDIQAKFPAYIWQTWKSAPGGGDFDSRLRPFEASWTEKHPGFVHEVITDEASLHLIRYLYASVPDVVEAYEAMPLPVIKADFFRYLILLARGGIYSDIDTTALKSATDWLPQDFDKASVGIVIGIEADPDRPDWKDWYARRIQFCQWTIQAKPGHPVLQNIVATITEKTLEMKSKHSFQKGQALVKSVMDYTGPGVWTDTIFQYFNDKNYFDFAVRDSNISYPDFFGITEPKRVGDVIVLPITSFSPGVGQMGAEDIGHKLAFVKHEFDGSWKPENERNP